MHHLLFRPSARPNHDLPLAARSVGHYRVGTDHRERSQKRPFFQVYWVVEGWGRITIRGQSHLFGPGQVAYYRPGDDHILNAIDDAWCYRFWTFDGDAAADIVTAFGLHDQSPRDVGPCPEHVFTQLEREIPDPLPGAELAAGATAYRLLSLVAAAGRAGSEEGETSIPDAAVATCRQQIDRHFANPDLDVTALATRLDLHRSTLCRRFQRIMGTSPSAYLAAKRLQHALALLTTTDLAIATVARRSGYADPDYFARRIRQITGQAPTDFRK